LEQWYKGIMKAVEQDSEGRAARGAPAKPAGTGASRRSKHGLDMDAFVPVHLTYLAQKISSSASALYRPKFGIGITDWRIVALLAVEPWITPGRICDATGLDKGAVSRSVRDLIEAGFVELKAGNGTQRRRPLALTPKGLSLHDRMVKAAIARQEQLLAGFSAEERALLIEFLTRMRVQVEALAKGSAAAG
jgi:DNA-binding MarR family transcriptional regulator